MEIPAKTQVKPENIIKMEGTYFSKLAIFRFHVKFYLEGVFFLGKHRCESIPSFPTRYPGHDLTPPFFFWLRRVPGIENMVTTGIWAKAAMVGWGAGLYLGRRDAPRL